MDNQATGLFIKQLRIEKNLTQKELADRLHVTDKAVSKWERGLSLPAEMCIRDSFKGLKHLAPEPDFRIHHIFFNVHGAKAFFAGDSCDDKFRFLAGTFHNPGSVFFRRIGIADKMCIRDRCSYTQAIVSSGATVLTFFSGRPISILSFSHASM